MDALHLVSCAPALHRRLAVHVVAAGREHLDVAVPQVLLVLHHGSARFLHDENRARAHTCVCASLSIHVRVCVHTLLCMYAYVCVSVEHAGGLFKGCVRAEACTARGPRQWREGEHCGHVRGSPGTRAQTHVAHERPPTLRATTTLPFAANIPTATTTTRVRNWPADRLTCGVANST